METLVGFAVGYLVGVTHGREGSRRVLDAWQAISRSEEVRGLVATGLSLAGGLAGRALARSGGVVAGSLAEALAERAREALAVGGRRLRAV
jgi:hypothetical protein